PARLVRLMSGKRTRGSGVPGRVAAVFCAASLAALSPLTASAQTTASPDDAWAPPPAGGSLPVDTKQPDKAYTLKTACVQRDQTQNGTPQERPWGQTYLQIDQAQ